MTEIGYTVSRRRAFRSHRPLTMLALCGALSLILIGTVAVGAVI